MALEDLEGKGSFWKVLEVFAKNLVAGSFGVKEQGLP
jgi:hypothetical protein